MAEQAHSISYSTPTARKCELTARPLEQIFFFASCESRADQVSFVGGPELVHTALEHYPGRNVDFVVRKSETSTNRTACEEALEAASGQ